MFFEVIFLNCGLTEASKKALVLMGAMIFGLVGSLSSSAAVSGLYKESIENGESLPRNKDFSMNLSLNVITDGTIQLF